MEMVKFETLEDKILEIRSKKVLIDKDLAQLYGVQTRDINKAVKNNPDKFPDGYLFELTKEEFETLRGKFSTTKFSKTRTPPKAFTEKGLHMLATILKGENARQATLMIIETFVKIKELSRNINSIMKTTNEEVQKELAQKSNRILEEIIDIEPTTKFEFNLGFAKVANSGCETNFPRKVSRSIKKIKNSQGK